VSYHAIGGEWYMLDELADEIKKDIKKKIEEKTWILKSNDIPFGMVTLKPIDCKECPRVKDVLESARRVYRKDMGLEE